MSNIVKPIAMRDAFLERIYKAMFEDQDIYFITADFGSPILDKMKSDFSDRFINVGIAEQNLINISAGLALEGKRVFAYAIAPFITMRCLEQIRVNLVLLSHVRPMSVTLIGVGAGYSYVVSGPTHQCYEDLSIMRTLPSVHIYSPSDHLTSNALFDNIYKQNGIHYLRLDAQILPVINELEETNLGYRHVRNGDDICILATGYMVHSAQRVAETLNAYNIDVAIVDVYSITDFNTEKLFEFLISYRQIYTLEEAFSGRGGFGTLFENLFKTYHISSQIFTIGVTPAYHFELGTRLQLHEKVGIGPDAITKLILAQYIST